MTSEEEKLMLRLIELAKKKPSIRMALYELLMEHFVTRDEIKQILDEIRKMREDFNREMINLRRDLSDKMTEMREDFNKRIQSLEQRMLEMREDFNKRIQSLEQRMLEMREDFNKQMQMFREQLSALGTRWGLLAEDAFREGIKGILERYGFHVEKWEYYDSEGIVYGAPSVIDVDVLIKDNMHMLIEIKASVDKSDVAELIRIGALYEKVSKVKPILVIISPFVRKRAKEFAKKMGVLVFTSSDEFMRHFSS